MKKNNISDNQTNYYVIFDLPLKKTIYWQDGADKKHRDVIIKDRIHHQQIAFRFTIFAIGRAEK